MSVKKETGFSVLQRFGDAKLPKSIRLSSAADFGHLKKNGEKRSGRFLVLLIAPSRSGQLKCGFMCSRKFDKSAVVRNRAKRIMKEVFRNSKAMIAPCEIGLIPRRNLLEAKIHEVQKEMIKLLKESGIWNAQ